jgi:hypothetical protein
MSYFAYCIGCQKDTEWIAQKCAECGCGPYDHGNSEAEIDRLKRVNGKVAKLCEDAIDYLEMADHMEKFVATDPMAWRDGALDKIREARAAAEEGSVK